MAGASITSAQTDLQPHDWQEAHSPTEFVEVKISGQRTTQLCRRRKTDARLIDSLSPHEQDAAGLIYAGFEVLTKGMGHKVQTFERRDPGRETQVERQQRLVDNFWRWSIEAQRERIQVSAVLDILAFGRGCREVETRRRKRNGWAKENLLSGLRLYCRHRGWPTTT